MEATYCPEDNKLRLYVGRVPRDEYLKLRADGWVSTPKQRENGGCDFVATWTPDRRDTCLEYADCILDEDQSPEERAADRAERFAMYRDKRTNEATGHADRYDAQPSAHGYQSQARAERAAARHDRIADRAVDAWSKAEYWTSRTAGVISHALYKSRPDVRMGRIKEIEADLRKREKSLEKWVNEYKAWQEVQAESDPEKQTKMAIYVADRVYLHHSFKHPRPETVTNSHIKENGTSLCTLLSMVRHEYGTSDITGAEACALFFATYKAPATEDDWIMHYKLRLAYENQMLEAQGGRAAHVEMIPGGWLGSRQIQKVNKSPATGRVVSVLVRDNKPSSTNHWGNPWPDGKARILSHTIETERLAADAYRAPTDEELSAFHAEQKQAKAQAKIARAAVAIPLINPTEAEAYNLRRAVDC